MDQFRLETPACHFPKNSYNGTLAPLSSPMHSLYPESSATIYVSGADCDDCLYIPNDGSSLTMGTPYYVRVTAYNALGSSAVGTGYDATEVATVTPNQIPFAPTDVSVTVVSGSRLEVRVYEREKVPENNTGS